MTRKAHEERGKKLAAQLLEALDAPEDPARTAELEAFEREKAAKLAAYHARVAAQSGRPSDVPEYARVLAEPGSMEARRALHEAWKARGELQSVFLGHQLEAREHVIAGTTSSQRGQVLRNEMARALALHAKTWAGELAELVDDFRFHRGLVAEVTLAGESFLAVASKLYELAPIQHVRLTAPLGDIEALLGSPSMKPLSSLFVPDMGAAFGDRGALALARNPHVENLRCVVLANDAISAHGVEGLAASRFLSEASYVDLTGNPGDPTVPIPEWLDQIYGGPVPGPGDALARRFGERPWLTALDWGTQRPLPDYDLLAV